jgi:hypothetical protein
MSLAFNSIGFLSMSGTCPQELAHHVVGPLSSCYLNAIQQIICGLRFAFDRFFKLKKHQCSGEDQPDVKTSEQIDHLQASKSGTISGSFRRARKKKLYTK